MNNDVQITNDGKKMISNVKKEVFKNENWDWKKRTILIKDNEMAREILQK